MDNAESVDRIGATRPPTPWETETRRRWVRLSAMIAETEQSLSQTGSVYDRKGLETSMRTLKRASLSVWIDARRIGIMLPGTPPGRSSALVEG